MRLHQTIDEDQRRLRRLAALMVSCAGLAEQAAGRSLPVRWLVIFILRCAEEVVGDYLDGLTGNPRRLAEPLPDDSPAEAFRLAQAFRALAAALALFVDDLFERWLVLPARRERAASRLPAAPGAPAVFDTS